MREFPVGMMWNYKGQIYRPHQIRGYTKADGTAGSLIDWETDCPECGDSFLVSTPMTFKAPSRRCQTCKRPGAPVKQAC